MLSAFITDTFKISKWQIANATLVIQVPGLVLCEVLFFLNSNKEETPV